MLKYFAEYNMSIQENFPIKEWVVCLLERRVHCSMTKWSSANLKTMCRLKVDSLSTVLQCRYNTNKKRIEFRQKAKGVFRLANRALDWLRQAHRDLAHAVRSREVGDHDWACFAAQQAAEKAIKALHLYFRQEAWGHVLSKLLKELPPEVEVQEELIDKAKVLDAFYIPARYPNGHAEGAPFENIGALQSKEAIDYAREIIEFISSKMAL